MNVSYLLSLKESPVWCWVPRKVVIGESPDFSQQTMQFHLYCMWRLYIQHFYLDYPFLQKLHVCSYRCLLILPVGTWVTVIYIYKVNECCMFVGLVLPLKCCVILCHHELVSSSFSMLLSSLLLSFAIFIILSIVLSS